MALDNTFLQDYQASQGDFGTVPGLAGLSPAQAIQQPQVPQAPIVSPQLQQPKQVTPLEEFGNHPMMQFYTQWKGASNEKRKTAEIKIAQDYPNPGAMGLPPVPGVEPKVDKETGKPEADPSAWGKFMKFIDSNPKYLLDIGATLLAPRSSTQSEFSHIASGLLSATNRLEQRKLAAAKEALDTRKTEGEIDLNKANAEAARRPKGAANAKLQRSKEYAAALRQEFPDLFPTDSGALLAAETQLAGKQTSYDKFVSKFTSDNLVFFNSDPVAAGKAAKMAASTLGLEPTQSLEDMEAGQRTAAIRKDPNLLYDYLKKNYPQATHEQIQARVKTAAGKEATRSGKDKKAPKKAPKATSPKAKTPTGEKKAIPKAKLDSDKRQLGAQERRAYMATLGSRSKAELQTYLENNRTALSSTQRIKLRRIIKSK